MTNRGMITAATARATAREWVETIGTDLPGFRGAWLAGSVNWLPDAAELPPWSDVDVMCVLEGGPSTKLGKLRSNGVLLEISHVDPHTVRSADALLANYRVVASFASGHILADPTGHLATVQRSVQAEFPLRERIIQRIDEAQQLLTNGVPAVDPAKSLAEQVMWVFPAGIITHLPLVAALQNPTVRRRYETSRALLERHGQLDLHERILEATGYGDLSRADVEQHYRGMVDVFDAASNGPATPFFFASDISAGARAIAVDGTWDLISRGLHRESMFWIIATWARAMVIMNTQYSGTIPSQYDSMFRTLLDTWGIHSRADLQRQGNRILALVPEVRELSLAMLNEHAT